MGTGNNGGRGNFGAGVFMYGGPPLPEPLQPISPFFPDPLTPEPMTPEKLKKLSDFFLGGPVPCVKCNRHIMRGMECPFCFAESLQPEEARVSKVRAAERSKKLAEMRVRLSEIVERMKKRDAENAEDQKKIDALSVELDELLKETP